MYAKQTLFFPNIACQFILQSNSNLEIKRIIHQVSHCTLDIKNDIPFNTPKQIYYRTIIFQVGGTFIVFHPQDEKQYGKAHIYGEMTKQVDQFIEKLKKFNLIISNQNDPIVIYKIPDGIHPFYHFTLLNSLCDISVVTKNSAELDDFIIYNIQKPSVIKFLKPSLIAEPAFFQYPYPLITFDPVYVQGLLHGIDHDVIMVFCIPVLVEA